MIRVGFVIALGASTALAQPQIATDQQEAYRPLELPEPTPIPRRDMTATERGADYYTGRPPMVVGPGLRLAPAASLRFGGDPRFAFALDVMSGGRIGLHPGDVQWVLVPEIGYSWRTPGAEQLISAGIGLGRGEGDSAPPSDARTIFGGLSYIPRIVLELDGPDRNLGFRHGLLWDHLETTLSLEASHQVLFRPDGDVHDLRVGFSIDIGRLLLKLVLD